MSITNSLVSLYRKMSPEWLRYYLYLIRLQYTKRNDNKIKRQVIDSIIASNTDDKEILDVKTFLENNSLSVFPTKIEAEDRFVVEKEDGLYYCLYDGKKMFFPPNYTKWAIEIYCKGIKIEQASNSPHCYLSDSFNVDSNTVIADIGAAEGNFTLSNIDKIKKAYIFEIDPLWKEPLRRTFESYKDKVEIVFSEVADRDEDGKISLDSFFEGKEKPNFLKMDVEGSEDTVLEGAKGLLEKEDMSLAICTYHRQEDATRFEKFFQERGFKTSFSNSYILLYNLYKERFLPPYLRRGVLRAKKS